jgi:hypothetical protein
MQSQKNRQREYELLVFPPCAKHCTAKNRIGKDIACIDKTQFDGT